MAIDISNIESTFSKPEELKSLIPDEKHHKKVNKAIENLYFRLRKISTNATTTVKVENIKYEEITFPLNNVIVLFIKYQSGCV